MSSQAAPGQLELARQFVNTLDVETGADELERPKALASWLGERGLLPRGVNVGNRETQQAVRLAGSETSFLLSPRQGPGRHPDYPRQREQGNVVARSNARE